MIEAEDLPEPIRTTPAKRTTRSILKPGMTLEDLEREVIRSTLRRTGGNRTEASQLLGISVRTLQWKLKEFGLE